MPLIVLILYEIASLLTVPNITYFVSLHADMLLVSYGMGVKREFLVVVFIFVEYPFFSRVSKRHAGHIQHHEPHEVQ